MSKRFVSEKRANSISRGIFLVSLSLLIITGQWWPGIILAIWATIASKQYLSGRIYYAILSSIVLLGIYFLFFFKFKYDILAPVLLMIAGLYLIIKEYYFTRDTNGEEKSEELLEDADVVE